MKPPNSLRLDTESGPPIRTSATVSDPASHGRTDGRTNEEVGHLSDINSRPVTRTNVNPRDAGVGVVGDLIAWAFIAFVFAALAVSLDLRDGGEAPAGPSAPTPSRAVTSASPTDRAITATRASRTTTRPALKAKAHTPRTNRALGKKLAAKRGWTGHQWTCLRKLWHAESRWHHKADNPSSSAYGIPQALPGSKMRTAGKAWRTSPRVQIRWGLKYVKGRYNTPCRAWAAFNSQGWY